MKVFGGILMATGAIVVLATVIPNWQYSQLKILIEYPAQILGACAITVAGGYFFSKG